MARNWLSADDVAILDVHLMRAGTLGGFFSPGMNVERHYFELEGQFLSFSKALGVRPSELDAVIWLEMANSAESVRRLLNRAGHPLAPTHAAPTPTKPPEGTSRPAHGSPVTPSGAKFNPSDSAPSARNASRTPESRQTRLVE